MMTDEPKPHSFDWIIEPIDIPMPPGGIPRSGGTLRVEVNVRASVAPSRAWAVAIIIWGLLVLLLLARAHAAEAWQQSDAWDGRHGADWGTTKHFTVEERGQTVRCSVWDWRGEQHVRCGE
jgi:hypothetical protein